MIEPHAFTEDGARRIVDSVRWSEGQRGREPGRRSSLPRPQWSGGGTAFEFVVVRERDFESTAQTILVTPVKKVDGQWQFQTGGDGSVITKRIWTHPRLLAKHYAGFGQAAGTAIGPGAQILKAFKVLGAWYLEQTIKWNMPFQDERFVMEGYMPRRQ